MQPHSTPNATCKQCGTLFYAFPSALKTKRGAFCSRSCFDAYRRTSPQWKERYPQRIERVCEQCGKTFYVQPHRLKDPKKAQFCSLECAYPSRTTAYVCDRCGKVFRKPPSSMFTENGTFCSRACRYPLKDDPVAYFWAHVDKRGPDDCWFWQAGCSNGYGMFSTPTHHQLAHRFSYELVNGPISKELQVCHSCDERCPPGDISYRKCVNPAHLWRGTMGDNMRDCYNKGRHAKGERSGPRLHPESRHYGERNGQAKLTNDAVRLIKARIAMGLSDRELSQTYGVSNGSIADIRKGRTWQHLK